MNKDKELMIKIFSAIKAVEDIEKDNEDLAAIGDILGNYVVTHLEDTTVFMKFIEWLSKTPNTSKLYTPYGLRKFLYAEQEATMTGGGA